MKYQESGWFRSLFILACLGLAGAGVANCGGDDTGTTGAGGGGTGGSGTDGGTGGTAGTGGTTTDGAAGKPDSSVGGAGGTGGTKSDATVSDVVTEAQVAACNATLADAGVTQCLTSCFCVQCTNAAVACLGNPMCFAIASCALNTLCFAGEGGVQGCFAQDTCGPTIAANSATGLGPALDFAPNPCIPTCVELCAGDAAPPTGDASEASTSSGDATAD